MNRAARRKQAQRLRLKGATATGALAELHLAARAAELTPEELAEKAKHEESLRVMKSAHHLAEMGIVLPGGPGWGE